jgi:hypothetical protein
MSKINQILLKWIPGDVHGLSWMKERGIQQRLAYKYFESKVLHKIGPGIFSKAQDKIEWIGIVRLLQEELKLPVHVSGKSALELQGHGHYAALNTQPEINLISYESKSYPRWIKKTEKDFELKFTSSNTFPHEEFLTVYEERGIKIKISSRELAILEYIESMDLAFSLETVENYMNSLGTLRPAVLQAVLEKCKSVKAKRVFLYLAEKLSLKFMEELNLEKISLGSGKRVVVKGGELQKKYLITVDRKIMENPF